MPGQKRLAGALAVAAVAVAISACGSSDSKTIPPANAEQLNSALTAVETAIDNGECGKAQQEAQSFVDAVNELPETVGAEDKETLRNAGANLEELAADPNQCKPPPSTGTTDLGDVSTSSTTVAPTTTDTETSTTSSTTTTEPQPETGGDEADQGGPPSGTGGPPTGTGGGPPSGTGGGGETGGGETGGGVGGGTGGTGGTGTGGTGGGTG
jgi:hypothetical protein